MAQPLPPSASRRPYLLRAMHEWMTDNNQTPHVVVDAGMQGVEVPRQYVQDGKIILNISYHATNHLSMTNHAVLFNARFGGTTHHINVPIQAVVGIYARETGQGMIFGDEDAAPTPPESSPPEGSPPAAPSSTTSSDAAAVEKSAKRAKFKVVK
jgi:stringent starvation protein B